MEIWKNIITPKGRKAKYLVSNYGRLKERKTGIIVQPEKDERGYLRVGWYYIHKVTANIFLGERPEGMEINHKDLNKENNNVDNLEYVTRAENMRHAYNSDKCEGLSYRPVVYLNKKSELIEHFKSCKSASEKYNLVISSVWTSANKNKKIKRIKGWVFLDEYEKYLERIEQDLFIVDREVIIPI